MTTTTKFDNNEILSDALDVVRNNADGSQFVRVYMHFNEDKTEFSVSAHIFSNAQSDDIDQNGQYELCSFEQSDLLDAGDCGQGEGVHEDCGCEPQQWFDSNQGEDWLKDKEEEIETALNGFDETTEDEDGE